MSELTKEQIDGIEKHVKQFDELWPYQADDMLELLRGYRKWLEEVEYHENELRKWRKMYDDYMATFGTPDVVSSNEVKHNRARLAALKGE